MMQREGRGYVRILGARLVLLRTDPDSAMIRLNAIRMDLPGTREDRVRRGRAKEMRIVPNAGGDLLTSTKSLESSWSQRQPVNPYSITVFPRRVESSSHLYHTYKL